MAWITAGIVIGALVLIIATACLVHQIKIRYSGVFVGASLKHKGERPSQRYKGERVSYLESKTKEKLVEQTEV